MQRVAILHLRQSTDHKRPGILWAEKLELPNRFQKFLALLIRGLLRLVVGWHVVRPHNAERLLPSPGGRCSAGVFERGSEVDPAPLPILAVATRAVVIDER